MQTKMKKMSDSERQEKLEAFGLAIAEKREEAVKGRKESGIEEVWLSCEESYLGIDDLNRSEFANAKWAKPTSMEGPVTTGKSSRDEVRSTAFVRLTSRYVDATSSKLSEILLPIDDKAFELSPTPNPDLIKNQDDLRQIMDAASGQPATRPAQPGEAGTPVPQTSDQALNPQPDPNAPQVPKTMADWVQEQMDAAADCADLAEKRIYDWMTESKYPAEARKVVFDSSRIGVGVLKGPFPDISTAQAITKIQNGIALQIEKKIVPTVRWVDPWNVFPDPACGENIHHGDYFLERDFLAPRMLKKLKDVKGYIGSQIDQVLKEGPDKSYQEGTNPNEKRNKKRFEVWYYYGTLTKDDLALANVQLDDIPEEQTDIYGIVTLVNDTVIRATINPLDSGKFPYNAWPWSRRSGCWAGVGTGEQVSMPQRMINAATRSLLNNAGISSGVQIVIDQTAVTPADKSWTLTPNKFWFKNAECNYDDMRKAFMAVEIPNVQQQLMGIIDYAFKLAEEATNMPLVTQGRDGETTPQTFGAAELQNDNAHTLLRNAAYSYDDFITEPLVDAFYEWLLLDPNVPDEEKGDFKINAHGSISMVEKAIQEQTLLQAGNLVVNPAFGIDPKRWFAEVWKTKRLDPRKIQYSPEDLAKLQQQPPPVAPAVQVAQINAQSRQQVQQAQSQAELQQLQQQFQQEQQMLQSGQATPHMASAQARIEAERIRASSLQSIEASRSQAELAYAQTEAQMARDNSNAKMQEMQMTRELAILQYAHQQNMTLEQVKADLAKTAMQENTRKELAAAEMQARQTEQAVDVNENAKDRQLDLHKHESQLQNQLPQ